MKEVIWVFGTSSAGKQTFINAVLTDSNLAIRLGWKNKKVTLCRESVNYPGDLSMPKIVKIREQIPKFVQKLINTYDVVLIKWQYADSYINTPLKLKHAIPEAKHRIILLVAPEDELKDRLNKKDWWQNKWNSVSDLVDDEIILVDKFIAELKNELEITILASGKDEGYKEVSFKN
ncbi:MAG TPA: hypothetical protein VLF63_03730 [Patescibacteria group bacterium]|nr:hypothetical protein [Patescibacteria group bacterium]